MNTRENLKEAFAGESQANRTYLAYGERAQKDGFAQVAELFRAVAAGEDLVDTPIRVCPVCGHTVIGDAPDECPLCKAKGARFQEIPITVVTVDAGEACTKPMLSNALARKHQADDMVQKEAASIAADLGIEIRSRTRVLAIDLDDYSRGRSQSGQSGRVLTIGGGLIGCEFANDLAVAGFEVAIVDPAPWPDCVRARSAVCWSLPALPVVVKTPALPLVVCPPPAGTSGAWELEPGDGEAAAIFRSEDGAEAGFALAGGKTRLLMQMAKRMPPLLPAAGSASRTLAMLFTN